MNTSTHHKLLLLVSLCVGALIAASISLAGREGGSPDGVVDQFAALSGARGQTDVLPARIQRGVDAMNATRAPVAETLYEGQHLKAQSRLLLGGVGSGSLDVYAYPTSKGRVCFTTSRGGGGCVTRSDPIAWGAFVPSQVAEGATIQYVGIVPNNVRMVRIFDGQARPTVFGNNAFFYELRFDGSWPTALEIEYRSGRVEVVNLPKLDS